MRGGEYVLEQLCDLFPGADIFTHVVDRSAISEKLLRHKIIETYIGRMPAAKKHYQKYLMLMPRALEELDLRDYDLVISSESGPAKGVLTRPGTPHICYVHSPMRYIWDLYPEYRDHLSFPTRQIFQATAHRLRQWDFVSAQRIDHVIANSSFVAKRISKYWRREAEVLNPPVDLSRFTVSASPGEYYLYVSELVPYKRADLALDAFRKLGKPLKIVGAGSELRRLKANAPTNVEFLGRVDNAELQSLYSGCKALIFPGEEDFGIVPLEAMASGRPVIAYGRGGVLDTVIPGHTGTFFNSQTDEALAEAIERFELEDQVRLHPAQIAAHAQSFSPERFRKRMMAIVKRTAPELFEPDLEQRWSVPSSADTAKIILNATPDV
jgi:glycosyltransferase involved in cell wall biosynthesis